MRKANAIVTVLLMVLFTVHMIRGGLVLTGAVKGGSPLFTAVTHLMLLLIAVHMTIGVILTVKSVMAMRKSKTSYFRLNSLFWARRISGFALVLFILFHTMAVSGAVENGMYVLNNFARIQLAGQILMVICLLVHLACNITPLRIALGLEDKKNFRADAIAVISILLFLAGAAFVIYYMRWNMV